MRQKNQTITVLNQKTKHFQNLLKKNRVAFKKIKLMMDGKNRNVGCQM